MSQTPDSPQTDQKVALSLLSRLYISTSQGLPLEEALEPLFAPLNALFHQCLPQRPLQRSHAEEVEAPANSIIRDKYVGECLGPEKPTDDDWSRRRYELWISIEKGEMWSELERRLGRGIFLMATGLDGLDEKL